MSHAAPLNAGVMFLMTPNHECVQRIMSTVQMLLILALVGMVGCNGRPPSDEPTSGQRAAYVGFHPIQHHEDLLNPDERETLSERYGDAVIICRVDPGSPADRAGLHAWDILRGYNGEAIHSLDDLDRAVGRIKAGMRLAMEVERDGAYLTINVVADPLPRMGLNDSFPLDRNTSFRRLLGAIDKGTPSDGT
jgi:hypothetical protein